MGTSLYPNQIDNSTSIPIATDGVTPVNAEVVNRLRDAIIAIESEGGVNPSGTYGSIRARLDALEALIASLGGGGGSGGTATQVQETIAITIPGQTSFTLSQVPVQASAVQMFLNGVKLEEGTEYVNTSNTTTVTYIGAVPISLTDVVEFWYLVDIGSISGTGAIEVQDNGSTVDPITNIINFLGGITITNPTPGTVNVTVAGGTATQVQETISVVTPGQTTFTLSQVPVQASAVQMFLNGSKLEEGVEYSNTPSTTTVTYTGPISLLITDTVEFWYLVDLGSISGTGAIEVQDNGSTVDAVTSVINFTGDVVVTNPTPGTVNVDIVGGTATQVQETIPVVTPGQTVFTLSQVPTQASGLQMFLNGVKLEEGVEYNNTPTTTTVTYTGLVPTSLTDTVEFWYLVDIGGIGGLNLQVKDSGSVVDSDVTLIDFLGKVSATSVVAGSIQVEVPESKIRVYRNTSNLAGAAAGIDQTVTWNATSSKITTTNASLIGSTQLSPSKSGTFLIQGQLTIQPTVDSISGITITILHNGSTAVHTISDYGAVWGVGINRSFSFNFPMELAGSDTVEVLWQHSGSLLSTTDLVYGDNLSWFSLVLV